MNAHEKPRLEISARDANNNHEAFLHVGFHLPGCGVEAYFLVDGDDHDSIEALKSALDTGYRAIQGWEERQRCLAVIAKEHNHV